MHPRAGAPPRPTSSCPPVDEMWCIRATASDGLLPQPKLSSPAPFCTTTPSTMRSTTLALLLFALSTSAQVTVTVTMWETADASTPDSNTADSGNDPTPTANNWSPSATDDAEDSGTSTWNDNSNTDDNSDSNTRTNDTPGTAPTGEPYTASDDSGSGATSTRRRGKATTWAPAPTWTPDTDSWTPDASETGTWTEDNAWTPTGTGTGEASDTGTWSAKDTWTDTATGSWKPTGTGTRSGKVTGSAKPSGAQEVYSGTTGAWVSGTFVEGATYNGPAIPTVSGSRSGLLLPTGSGALNVPGTNVTGNMTIPSGTAILPPGASANASMPGNTPITSPSEPSPSPSPTQAASAPNSGALRRRELTKKTQYGLVLGAAGGLVLAGTLL
ncbi:hypothetical protein A1Q2_01486 [Trichosporon asahii var. asahii CBS 8904]|uniref:Uncharacterized protein n=1 Tax=Trichosporon asahii var. asahii (strain CBS 8904) TaxID=1220162 RepID=K1VXN9_TRIAC|nr:hypothetical protein A1Q2_01486 [Trichosporon asahii var. asahii CBS 8904]